MDDLSFHALKMREYKSMDLNDLIASVFFL